MAKQDYGKGSEFVPTGGAFPAVSMPPQGPKTPSVTDVGGTAVPVFTGGAWGGDTIDPDGGHLMDDAKPKFPTRLKSGKLPQNA